MKPPKRMFKARRKQAEPQCIASASPTFKEKPVLLTEPTMKDLAAYGPEMLRALEEGYNQGLEEPCVLVIWRGGQYAKERGLGKSETPLIFKPISGAEFEQLTGEPAYVKGNARDVLPHYAVALAGQNDIEATMGVDYTVGGVTLSWRHSQQFRRHMGPALGEDIVGALEHKTGVARDD